jgi:transcriptional regulator with XRE-family HTH domain
VSIGRSSPHVDIQVFGRRLREARLRMGLPQDKLGVRIGLDEQTASARISRYESGVHEPPVRTARALAEALGVPLGYLYCDDDRLAAIMLAVGQLPPEEQEVLLATLRQRLGEAIPDAPANGPSQVDALNS